MPRRKQTANSQPDPHLKSPQMSNISETPSNHNPHFFVNIQQYTGEPDFTEFFFSQIRDVQKLNKWNDEQTLVYIKSKLAGSALKFYISTPHLSQINTVSQLHIEFKKFFTPETESNAIIEFDSLTLLPEENIINYSLRIDTLAAKLYPEMDDINRNKIKFNKLISTVSPDLRLYLLQNQIVDYNTAIEKGQFMQNLNKQNKLFNNNDNSEIKNLSEQVLCLQKELESIKNNKSDDIATSTKPVQKQNNHSRYKNNTSYNRQRYPQNFQPTNNFVHGSQRRNYKNYKPRFSNSHNLRENRSRFRNVICQICNLKGHEALNCFKYKNDNRQRKLNPTATTFQPKSQEHLNHL